MRGRPDWLPIAREGFPFIILAAVLAVLVLLFIGLWWIEAVFLALFVFVVAFFRDPERVIPEDPDAIVSPADGKVIKVEVVSDDRFLLSEALKISIFMNVFNVHVNRAPADSKVLRVIYNPGRFFNASLDKASLENEQNAVVAERPTGEVFAFNQIAGLIARRIVCYASAGTKLKKGERFGLIRFGSRLDVFLPAGSKVVVKKGDKVRAGSSTLGYWR
jgi:phosphatidylserine decarboxylase